MTDLTEERFRARSTSTRTILVAKIVEDNRKSSPICRNAVVVANLLMNFDSARNKFFCFSDISDLQIEPAHCAVNIGFAQSVADRAEQLQRLPVTRERSITVVAELLHVPHRRKHVRFAQL